MEFGCREPEVHPVEFHQFHVDLKTAFVDDSPPFPLACEYVRDQSSDKGHPNAAEECKNKTDGHFVGRHILF